MDRIAFVIGNTFLYWNSIILTLAAAAAISFFLTFYLSSDGSASAAAVAIPLALVLSVILGRLVHWYFRPDSYTGFAAAMTDFTSGNYALLGVFAACLLTVLILWAVRLEKNPGVMLDAMSLAGCIGIALGRLSCFFSTADRGQILESTHNLPFAYPVINAVSGATEYRLATFVLQSMACWLIFALLLGFFLLAKRRRGDLTLLFLLLYGMSQAVLDSTRYDSLFMRSNGFISVVQLAGAACMVVVSVIFSVRMVRNTGMRGWYPILWIGMLVLMGGAGYMEYYVQRHGDLALLSYSVMTACLSAVVVLALITYARSGASKDPPVPQPGNTES